MKKNVMKIYDYIAIVTLKNRQNTVYLTLVKNGRRRCRGVGAHGALVLQDAERAAFIVLGRPPTRALVSATHEPIGSTRRV